MDKSTSMQRVDSGHGGEAVTYPAQSTANIKPSTQATRPNLDTAAIQTWLHLGIGKDKIDRNVPLRYLHPVTPSPYGPFGSQTRDARSGAPMSLSHPGMSEPAVRAETLKGIRQYNSPLDFGAQSHAADLRAFALPNNLPPILQHTRQPVRPTIPDLSSFEAFMEEIEKSSPTRPFASTPEPGSSQTSASTTYRAAYSDPMHQSSVIPPTHGPQRAMLRRDTRNDRANVISPAFVIALPCGDVIELAHSYPSKEELEKQRAERS